MDVARSYTGTAPHWILAEKQSNARGRRGRSWLAADGAFAGTLVLPVDCPPQMAACRSFVVACGLFDALSQFVPDDTLSQKWPNDVLLNNGKVAGILLEAIGTGTHVDRVNIGAGVNLGYAPKSVPDAAFPPVGVADVIGYPVPVATFLPVLTQSILNYETRFQQDGFAAIRSEWTRNAARLGQDITAQTYQGKTTGKFQGIDDTGNLILLTPAGRAVIPAADIYF